MRAAPAISVILVVLVIAIPVYHKHAIRTGGQVLGQHLDATKIDVSFSNTPLVDALKGCIKSWHARTHFSRNAASISMSQILTIRSA
jgi:hypothetical protein